MNVQLTRLSEIKPNPNNPRLIKDEKFEKLVKSIREFPEMLKIRPIVVNADMVVLGGNMRLKACKAAGLKEVPVIQASELTEEQQREFIIKDNVGFGEWDWELIAKDWDTAELADWGLDVPEFGTAEEPTAEEDNYEIPDEIKTDIVLGDLFEIGEHRLLCGDSTDADQVARLMDGKKADMVFTDPPYNVDYSSKNEMLNKADKGNRIQTDIENDKLSDSDFYGFLLLFYSAFSEVTKPGGAWYVFHADTEGINFRNAFKESGLFLKQVLVWVKNVHVLGRQDYQWKHEPCLYGWKPGAAHYFTPDRTKTTVIEDKLDIKKLKKEELVSLLSEMISDKTKTTVLHCDKPSVSDVHPTMKPILLIAPLIENSSKQGWIVADAFLGSGSTMVAAHQLKRRCYGLELDPKYCQVIVDRMRKLDPSLLIKKNGIPL
jgi:site-specific DNA-methyltransferase (adenine-specific)